MKAFRTRRKTLKRTTFFELIGSFIDAAKNDAEILASVRQLFDRSEVRLVGSLAPVRLAATADRKRSWAQARARTA